ncbi:DsbA family protein [Ornithinimicrobium cerasi]|uniref:Protein-disulfide isomerase n=1 Tax=Ornithinimicrobium cerasi TaxID=2248773 RepID=A0A285VS03_9MICO|nr:thioredoxin domain-containing protein [Ornithinimicrobium cerasi]SOC56657.1 Protein-disulfide isomerase [Ornithinimicrobium cerasi]
MSTTEDPLTPMAAPAPAGDSRAQSIAWAVAAVVVALVIGFIAWLAMGEDRDDSSGAASGAPSSAGAPAGATTGDDAAESPEAAPTPPPEVQQLLLDLQRRDADDPLAEGEVDAPVVMIEYADYRCPYCARFHLQERPDLQPLVEDGTLRIEFRDLVLFDEPSQLAAVAARAAAEQEVLAAYQTALFERSVDGQAELTREDLVAMAEQVGVADLEAFGTALDDERLHALVRADTEEARAIGVTSTPTFLVNTTVVQGAYEAEYMIDVIEQQRELVGAGAR